MSFSDYGITLKNTEAILLLTAAVAAVLILMTVFLRAVGALSQYRLMRASGANKAWRSFVPLLSLVSLGDLAAKASPRRRAAGKAAAVFWLLSVAAVFCGTVCLLDSGLRLLFSAEAAAAAGAATLESGAWTPVYSAVGILLAGLALWLLKQIFAAVCLAEVYKNAGISPFLCILGVIFPILTPIFLACCAGKALKEDV